MRGGRLQQRPVHTTERHRTWYKLWQNLQRLHTQTCTAPVRTNLQHTVFGSTGRSLSSSCLRQLVTVGSSTKTRLQDAWRRQNPGSHTHVVQKTYTDSHKPIMNLLPRTGTLLCISMEGHQPVLHPHRPTWRMLPAHTNPGDTSNPTASFTLPRRTSRRWVDWPKERCHKQ